MFNHQVSQLSIAFTLFSVRLGELGVLGFEDFEAVFVVGKGGLEFLDGGKSKGVFGGELGEGCGEGSRVVGEGEVGGVEVGELGFESGELSGEEGFLFGEGEELGLESGGGGVELF